uniref:Lactamase_B domain-containing protein n=1 Tax=Heterorhabditis bacteriophora TaxID=37862 RepID=A0A1I7WQU0_HETBA
MPRLNRALRQMPRLNRALRQMPRLEKALKHREEKSPVNLRPSGSSKLTVQALGNLPLESTKEEWEQKMKDLSEQLSNILKQIKKTKKTKPQDVTKFVPKTRPKLTILRNGSAEQTDDGRYDFVATMTLIQDDGKNILVDTGLGTDINGRTNMITGGIHDFPDALHYQGWFVHQSTFFNLNALFEYYKERDIFQLSIF